MNTDTPTVPREMHAHAHVFARLQTIKPVVLSLMLTLPAGFISYSMMMMTRTDWPHARLLIVVILSLMVVNFLMLAAIEPYRRDLGAFTIPAMLSFIGMTIFCVLMEALNRFVLPHSFSWITPFAIASLALIYGSVFREPNMTLKIFLCVNGLALTLLWCLGDAGKMSLPF